MWSQKYSWCDIINTVDVMAHPHTVDTMSNIVGVMTQTWWFEVIKWGCDVLYRANDATHMASVMSHKGWDASSSLAFHMMYSASKLIKQGDNIQPWHIPFPIWNQSIVPCLVLTVASWPTYRCLRRQVRWSGSPFSLRIFYSLLWSIQSKTLA